MAFLLQCLREQRLRSGERILIPIPMDWLDNEPDVRRSARQPQDLVECALKTSTVNQTSTDAGLLDRDSK